MTVADNTRMADNPSFDSSEFHFEGPEKKLVSARATPAALHMGADFCASPLLLRR